MKPAWNVYLVRCRDGSLYCGSTTDPERRVRQHNGLLAGGARYTAARRPVTLVAARTCVSRRQAQRLEARVKRLGASAKISFLLSVELCDD